MRKSSDVLRTISKMVINVMDESDLEDTALIVDLGCQEGVWWEDALLTPFQLGAPIYIRGRHGFEEVAVLNFNEFIRLPPVAIYNQRGGEIITREQMERVKSYFIDRPNPSLLLNAAAAFGVQEHLVEILPGLTTRLEECTAFEQLVYQHGSETLLGDRRVSKINREIATTAKQFLLSIKGELINRSLRTIKKIEQWVGEDYYNMYTLVLQGEYLTITKQGDMHAYQYLKDKEIAELNREEQVDLNLLDSIASPLDRPLPKLYFDRRLNYGRSRL